MINDFISDMLTRIRNGYMVGKKAVLVPYSKLNENILGVLQQQGYIGHWEAVAKIVKGKKTAFQDLKVNLVYKNNQPAIEKIKRISKGGRRVYIRAIHLKRAMAGYGMTIISTPKGVLTDQEAKKSNQGGEVLCQVW